MTHTSLDTARVWMHAAWRYIQSMAPFGGSVELDEQRMLVTVILDADIEGTTHLRRRIAIEDLPEHGTFLLANVFAELHRQCFRDVLHRLSGPIISASQGELIEDGHPAREDTPDGSALSDKEQTPPVREGEDEHNDPDTSVLPASAVEDHARSSRSTTTIDTHALHAMLAGESSTPAPPHKPHGSGADEQADNTVAVDTTALRDEFEQVDFSAAPSTDAPERPNQHATRPMTTPDPAEVSEALVRALITDLSQELPAEATLRLDKERDEVCLRLGTSGASARTYRLGAQAFRTKHTQWLRRILRHEGLS